MKRKRKETGLAPREGWAAAAKQAHDDGEDKLMAADVFEDETYEFKRQPKQPRQPITAPLMVRDVVPSCPSCLSCSQYTPQLLFQRKVWQSQE